MRVFYENDGQQELPEGFANTCYKIDSPILLQKLINDFAVCEHYSGTLLLVEDASQKGTTLFNRSTQNMPLFYVMLHKVYIFKLMC